MFMCVLLVAEERSKASIFSAIPFAFVTFEGGWLAEAAVREAEVDYGKIVVTVSAVGVNSCEIRFDEFAEFIKPCY